MAFVRTTADVDPPFGPAVVKRGLHIHAWVEDPPSSKGGVYTAKDISAARYTYALRVWTSDDDTDPVAALSGTVTKGAAAATGELDHYQTCGATVYDTLAWEIVEVDNNNADANTRSTFRETVKWRWYQPIVDAP